MVVTESAINRLMGVTGGVTVKEFDANRIAD
jgi:hypothetical protein